MMRRLDLIGTFLLRKSDPCMMKWKIVSEEEILSADLFKVYSQHIVGPNSLKRTYSVVRRKSTVCVLPITDKREIILVGQERYLLNQYTWELTAGFIEEGEEPLAAAKRELKEETGIEAKKWKKLTSYEMSSTGIKATSHVFIASNLTYGEPAPEESEEIDVKKVSMKSVKKMISTGQIKSAVSVAAILLLFERNAIV